MMCGVGMKPMDGWRIIGRIFQYFSRWLTKFTTTKDVDHAIELISNAKPISKEKKKELEHLRDHLEKVDKI